MLEMFKAKNKIEPNLLQGIFEENEYKGPTLRSSKSFKKPNVRTVRFGERSLQNLFIYARQITKKSSAIKRTFFILLALLQDL